MSAILKYVGFAAVGVVVGVSTYINYKHHTRKSAAIRRCEQAEMDADAARQRVRDNPYDDFARDAVKLADAKLDLAIKKLGFM